MTKAEAIAITRQLPKAQKHIQEVQLRLQMHKEGKIEMNVDFLDNAIERLSSSVEIVDLICRMAHAELN